MMTDVELLYGSVKYVHLHGLNGGSLAKTSFVKRKENIKRGAKEGPLLCYRRTVAQPIVFLITPNSIITP